MEYTITQTHTQTKKQSIAQKKKQKNNLDQDDF